MEKLGVDSAAELGPACRASAATCPKGRRRSCPFGHGRCPSLRWPGAAPDAMMSACGSHSPTAALAAPLEPLVTPPVRHYRGGRRRQPARRDGAPARLPRGSSPRRTTRPRRSWPLACGRDAACVVTDLKLPGHDGARPRGRPRGPEGSSVPVVLITAHDARGMDDTRPPNGVPRPTSPSRFAARRCSRSSGRVIAAHERGLNVRRSTSFVRVAVAIPRERWRP